MRRKVNAAFIKMQLVPRVLFRPVYATDGSLTLTTTKRRRTRAATTTVSTTATIQFKPRYTHAYAVGKTSGRV